MKHIIPLLILVTSINFVTAQTNISGTVTDTKNIPIVGANVYLEGTYDGASTTEDGSFNFETFEEGSQTLVISMLSYEAHYEVGDVTYLNNLKIQLREAVNSLTGVTLTAGTFEAGDNSKVSALKPLDIVTTAGAVGDFVAALQTLPGTTSVMKMAVFLFEVAMLRKLKCLLMDYASFNLLTPRQTTFLHGDVFPPSFLKVSPSVQEDILLNMGKRFPVYCF